MNINRKRRNCSITTSSMSDIGFLLLIFIMLISLMNQRHEQPIEYTEALNLEKTQAEKNFEIWVMADGGVYVDGIRQTGESLEQNIAAAVVANPGVRIHVIADRNTPLFVYCRSGARSSQAVSILKGKGYGNVTNIGGIAAYTGKVER